MAKASNKLVDGYITTGKVDKALVDEILEKQQVHRELKNDMNGVPNVTKVTKVKREWPACLEQLPDNTDKFTLLKALGNLRSRSTRWKKDKTNTIPTSEDYSTLEKYITAAASLIARYERILSK